MPTVHGGGYASSSISSARDTSGRTNDGLPALSTPRSANTFLARSIPTTTTALDSMLLAFAVLIVPRVTVSVVDKTGGSAG